MATVNPDKYGHSEEGSHGNTVGGAQHASVSGSEGGRMSAGTEGLGLSSPRQNGSGRNFKMSSDDSVSESGKQA